MPHCVTCLILGHGPQSFEADGILEDRDAVLCTCCRGSMHLPEKVTSRDLTALA